jgi:hypothetical protein
MTSIESLLTITAEKIRFVLNRIDQLKILRFPSTNPNQLITMFESICNILLTKIDPYLLEYNNSTDDDEKEWIIDEIHMIANMVKKYIAPHLRYIEGASVDRNPCSLVNPLQKLTQDIFPNTKLIVRPQWKYNFAKVEIMNYYLKSTITIFSEDDKKLIFNAAPKFFEIISFPGFEKTNILLHVNLGHELGHHLQEEYFKREGDNYLFKIKDAVAKFTRNKSYEQKTININEKTKKVVQIRKRFIEEIISDLFCLKLFGPATLFAFLEVATFDKNFDSFDENSLHPPWRTRLRILMEAIEWQDYNESFKKYTEFFDEEWAPKAIEVFENDMLFIDRIVKDRVDEKNIRDYNLTRIAYNSVNESLIDIKQFLDERIGDYLSYSIDELCKRILFSIQRLYHDIPPNEFEEDKAVYISDLKTIFNAGWLYKRTFLSSIFKAKKQDVFFDDLDKLNRLILKGIELSDINESFSQYKKKRGNNGGSFN